MKKQRKNENYAVKIAALILFACIVLLHQISINNTQRTESSAQPTASTTALISPSPTNESFSADVNYSNTAITFTDTLGNTITIPAYDLDGDGSTAVNNNEPFFTDEDLSSIDTWYSFSDLDDYGRAGVSNAVVGKETMQTEERGSLSDITPSGWYACKANLASDTGVKDGCNRSHLIANKLLGSVSDDPRNLITGSSTFNQEYMLAWEKKVMQACDDGLHVRYRVTPIFDTSDGIKGSETAHGVLMEAESIEDQGETVKYCVYVYNVEPGWSCDYLTGEWERIQ
ncbi:MAG: DNA/RNA non-specific endonuclease [Erysipelotrichaceae bacterium]|jgi:DNA-entry nuclease|nr:DNA/RNA non-specific endonuclease [Erysipelotrichaceae bacterium]MCH4045017.1 DNA/RNA non-specific endonuclease [Erysipelotrichaceae bacterium]MCH4122229.1 DNA/RNA non-specific endonuclease [Erysipelotrichaceae bacterium]MCI1362410.1 DNA/RNA non-specific endonuclease [Solobacterium sp.]MCI1462292.1 DNA/RNA non-specific endonuclease [Solobacterium sp.]